jgi:hypothetical protein
MHLNSSASKGNDARQGQGSKARNLAVWQALLINKETLVARTLVAEKPLDMH